VEGDHLVHLQSVVEVFLEGSEEVAGAFQVDSLGDSTEVASDTEDLMEAVSGAVNRITGKPV
jgi:hypothetical protein